MCIFTPPKNMSSTILDNLLFTVYFSSYIQAVARRGAGFLGFLLLVCQHQENYTHCVCLRWCARAEGRAADSLHAIPHRRFLGLLAPF